MSCSDAAEVDESTSTAPTAVIGKDREALGPDLSTEDCPAPSRASDNDRMTTASDLDICQAITAHISMRGNVQGKMGDWIGDPDGVLPIEGVHLAVGKAPDVGSSIECQLFYPDDLRTPWTHQGEPSGSTGLSLACIGIRFRLSGQAAEWFDCYYDVAFADGQKRETLPGRQITLSPSGSAVVAFRLYVLPREAAVSTTGVDGDRPLPAAASGLFEREHGIRLTLQSPAFGTHPAMSMGLGHAPAIATEGETRIRNKGLFEDQAIDLHVFDDCFVSNNGVVFDATLNVVYGNIGAHADTSVAQIRKQIASCLPASIRRRKGSYLLCNADVTRRHGDSLIEIVPRISLSRQLLAHWHLLPIIAAGSLPKTTIECLDLMDVPSDDVTLISGDPIWCERLVVIRGLTREAAYQSPLCLRLAGMLSQNISPGREQNIFVVPNHGAATFESRSDLLLLLEEHGFIFIDPANIPLSKLISTFKAATTVVGFPSEAMTNIAFCPSGSHILLLTELGYTDNIFWFLAQHAHHRYTEIRYEPSSQSGDQFSSYVA